MSGRLIETTETHLFMLEDGSWRAAENLKAGDKVLTSDGKVEIIESVEKISYNENKTIYNLNVEYFHTYFVSDKCVLVHNIETDNLKLTERESRLPHNPDTPGKLDGDHAGHLAGDRFGGSPELNNLVSQSSNVNLSQYKKIENQWAKAIEQGKK